jgi:hypothetical protein
LQTIARGSFWVGIGRAVPISCGGFVFLISASGDDPDRVVEQWL